MKPQSVFNILFINRSIAMSINDSLWRAHSDVLYGLVHHSIRNIVVNSIDNSLHRAVKRLFWEAEGICSSYQLSQVLKELLK